MYSGMEETKLYLSIKFQIQNTIVNADDLDVSIFHVFLQPLTHVHAPHYLKYIRTVYISCMDLPLLHIVVVEYVNLNNLHE